MPRPPSDRPPGMMPTRVRYVVITLALLITFAPVVYFIWANQRVNAAQEWPTVTGEVLSSGLRISSSDDDTSTRRTGGNSIGYTAQVHYLYTVNGVRYDSDRVWLTGLRISHHIEEAQEVVDAHPQGGPATVIYNPEDPTDAALRLNRPRWEMLFITLIGVAFMSATWILTRGPRLVNGVEPRASRELRQRLSCLATLMPFAAIAGPILYLMFFY